MLIETFIRKQLRLTAHTVTQVEETEECLLVYIDRLGKRLLRCGVCRQRCMEVHDIRKEREWHCHNLTIEARFDMNYETFETTDDTLSLRKRTSGFTTTVTSTTLVRTF